MSTPKCTICDLPEVAPDGNEPWQGNQELYCERVYLARRGLHNDAALKRCVQKGQNWRVKFVEAQAEIAELKHALAKARAALSRHHAASHRDAGAFRDNARIE